MMRATTKGWIIVVVIVLILLSCVAGMAGGPYYKEIPPATSSCWTWEDSDSYIFIVEKWNTESNWVIASSMLPSKDNNRPITWKIDRKVLKPHYTAGRTLIYGVPSNLLVRLSVGDSIGGMGADWLIQTKRIARSQHAPVESYAPSKFWAVYKAAWDTNSYNSNPRLILPMLTNDVVNIDQAILDATDARINWRRAELRNRLFPKPVKKSQPKAK